MAVEIVGAPVRRGKTMWATRRARNRLIWVAKQLEKDPSFVGRVFSNYPIYVEGYGYTKVWEPGFETEPIYDSLIIIDEAHRFYNSRKIKNFTSDMHDFFAWSGQRGNDIILITHDPGRVDTIIREVCEAFHYVRKFSLFGRPVLFMVDEYESEENYKQKLKPVRTDLKLFSMKIARCYDTHFFRNQPDEIPEFPDWSEKYGLCVPEYPSLISKIKNAVGSVFARRNTTD